MSRPAGTILLDRSNRNHNREPAVVCLELLPSEFLVCHPGEKCDCSQHVAVFSNANRPVTEDVSEERDR